MKFNILCFLISFSTQIELYSQCNVQLMRDTSSEYLEQLCYTKETEKGFITYMRRYYQFSNIKDDRNGIYLQERDLCFNLVKESIFIRNLELQDSVFHPKDYLFMFDSKDSEFIWILSGSKGIKMNLMNKQFIKFNYPFTIDPLNMNFIELGKNKYCIMNSGSFLFLLDSTFQIQSRFRSLAMPINDFDSMNLFFKFEPLTLPLFANDSTVQLTYLDRTIKWEFDFPGKTPYLQDWYSMHNFYYLVGSEDPNGNNVAFEPVIYKLDKQGNLIYKVSLTTNIFKSASATRCLVNNDYLYIAGYQTISRKPKELKQVFFAKLDGNLNLIWKKDLDLGCGPINSEFRNMIKSKDGGIIVPFVENTYGDTCEPILIKLDVDGNITSSQESIKQMEIKVYPNPGSEMIYIHSDHNINHLEVYNLNGSIIQSLDDVYINELNVTGYPKGMYLLKIYYEGKYKIERVIIE